MNNQYKKPAFALLAGMLTMTACVDTEIAPYAVDKPQSLAQYEYLDAYGSLKSYIDRAAHPGFLLGTGVSAYDYIKKGLVYRLTNANFDQMSAGNAMKYASVVKDDGTMDFSTVMSFVDAAREAGMSIYGHTLCWHEQQNVKWLNSLIADREIEVDPGLKDEIEDSKKTYAGLTKFPFFVMGYEPEIVDGILTVPEYPGEWYQFFVMDGLTTVPGQDYIVTVRLRGSKEGSMNVQLGNWGKLVEKNMPITEDWQEVSTTFSGIETESSFVVVQPGTYDGKLEIEWVKLSHLETPVVKIEMPVESFDFTDDRTLGGWGANLTMDVQDNKFVIVNSAAANDWEKQICYERTTPLEEGKTYGLRMRIKGSKAGFITAGLQNPDGYKGCGNFNNVNLTTDWETVTVRATCSGENALRVLLNVGAYEGTIWIDTYELFYEESANKVILTPEEKAEILTNEMERWVKGMMEATGGYVKAWDVVNEAISGGPWGQRYDLQHAATSDNPSNKFFWQDYLGDDFVRVPVRFARQYFAENGGNPDELKLFINDYNLESDWDDNQKLKSLISWIEQWESDGVTRIDGIGSQMHINYYLDPATQASKEDHIVKMLQLMAATGKLVRITELDMGLVDENGQSIKTEDITFEQHQLMAEHYKFVIQKYFEIVPVAQQYGICQWAQTDSPADSGWRGGEPIGLWNLDYQRKPTYAGFADGLAGK